MILSEKEKNKQTVTVFFPNDICLGHILTWLLQKIPANLEKN